MSLWRSLSIAGVFRGDNGFVINVCTLRYIFPASRLSEEALINRAILSSLRLPHLRLRVKGFLDWFARLELYLQ